MFGSVLGNRLTKKLVLVLPRTPAAVDEELDAVVSGVRGSSPQGTEQIRIYVAYSRKLVVENGGPVGDRAVGLAELTAGLLAENVIRTANDLDRECGRRGRGRQQPVAEGCNDRGDHDEQEGGT